MEQGPENKPAFLQPTVSPEYPGEVEPTYDEEIDTEADEPATGYRERWREVARLAARGIKVSIIAKTLNYTPVSVTKLFKKPWVQKEIARYRAELDTEFGELARDGIRTMHQMLLDPKTKDTVRADLGKWAAEKKHGKAVQEVRHESDTLASFMDILRGIQVRGEPIDVTPQQAQEQIQGTDASQGDPWDNWLDARL